jgi:Ca-activated chloride channel family protein
VSTPLLPGRTKAARRRKRHLRTRTLVFAAVTGCVLLVIGRGTGQVMNRLSCENSPVNINIAVSSDIFPAISQIADVFNREQRQADGHCIAVQINPGSPATAAAQLDGQHPNATGFPINAWIPDSSLWVDEVQRFPVGASTVYPAGFSVARSPLMIVMPQAAAARTPGFYKAGWQLLLPPGAGGPAEPADLRVDLPDPTQTAAGLDTLIEVSRLLGSGQAARVRFTKFAHYVAVTSYFDDPASLSSLVSLAQPPLNSDPVTVTTEQAVLAYDAANPRQPLAAMYPSGKSPALGSPEFDYPYVLLATSDPAQLAAATAFGQMLRSRYAASVIRFSGFRSGGQLAGLPDRFPASYGLDSQLLQVAPSATAVEEPIALQSWNKISLGSRDLVMIDVSSNMARSVTLGGPSYEQQLTQAANIGLGLFADDTDLGLWEYASDLKGQQPYRPLVSIGPLPSDIGVTSRREVLEHINATLTPTTNPDVASYGTILAGYKYLLNTYQPDYFNAEIVLGSGIENAPGDITGPELVHELGQLNNPSRKVAIIMVIFGDPPNFPELQEIAQATGGEAYQITSPSQVAGVFFQALAQRLCNTTCLAP